MISELDALIEDLRSQSDRADEPMIGLVAFALRRLDDIARSLATIAQHPALPRA